MLKTLRSWRGWLAGLVVLAVLLGGTTIDSSILPQEMADKCGQRDQTKEKYCTAYPVLFFFVGKAGKFLDDHHAAVTAIATVFIAAFTIFLAVATGNLKKATDKLWLAASDQGKDFKNSLAIAEKSANAASLTAESSVAAARAYIVMSHISPLGLNISDTAKLLSVKIEVKNCGRTPARITAVIINHLIRPRGEALPDFEGLKSGALDFVLYACTDYIDIFGKRYRSRYARRFDRNRTDNNLIFVTQRNWNHNSARRPGEGNDWGDGYS